MGEPQELGALPGSDTERVLLSLTERPALRAALPAWPILGCAGTAPFARTTSPVNLSKDDSAHPGPLTRKALRPSPRGRDAAEFRGFPSPDLAAVLLLQLEPQDSRPEGPTAG